MPHPQDSHIVNETLSYRPPMNRTILDLFQRRFACHHFLPDRAIPAADLDTVLEAGRLSPSSFGLEHWRFVVLTGAEDKAAMQAACFGQPQVGEAGAVVVILAKVADLGPDTGYVQTLLAREYPGEALAPALANYRAFHAATDIAAWSVAQCHIAAANMMTAATAVGLDSCAIGGFLHQEVARILGLEEGRYAVAMVLPLGYRAEEPPAKQRLSLAELVEYR